MEKPVSTFFRKDLNLKNRWWHRFFVVVFIASFVWMAIFMISDAFDSGDLPRYRKIGVLSDRISSELRLINDLVGPGEKIAINEGYLNSLYDKNGGWLLEQANTYCSTQIYSHVEEISARTGIRHYKGNFGLISLDDFKDYLAKNDAYCVDVLELNPYEDSGSAARALSWAVFVDPPQGWGIYTFSAAATAIGILKTVLIVAVVFFIILTFYYKVILYIVFGRRKINQ